MGIAADGCGGVMRCKFFIGRGPINKVKCLKWKHLKNYLALKAPLQKRLLGPLTLVRAQ
jgi:hypothetical protein